MDPHFRYVATGVDLAISQRANADFTAMVSGKLYGHGKKAKLYILPFPVNVRMTFPETVAKMKEVSRQLGDGYHSRLFIEEVAYQSAAPQQMKADGYHAEGVKVPAGDKRERLALLTPLIQEGKIVFPSRGCENLISQLTGFGIEKHDDLADAFAILVQRVWEDSQRSPQIIWLDGPNPISIRREIIHHALTHPDEGLNPGSTDWGDMEDAAFRLRNKKGRGWTRIIG